MAATIWMPINRACYVCNSVYILCDFTYMAVWEQQHYRDAREVGGHQWLGVWRITDYKEGAQQKFLRNGTILYFGGVTI